MHFIIIDSPAEEKIAVDHSDEGKAEARSWSALIVHRFLAFLKVQHYKIEVIMPQ